MVEPGNTPNVLWRTLRDNSDEGRVLRRRVGATAALVAFFLTFMVAIGFGAIVLTLVVVAAAAAAVVACVAAIRRHPGALAAARDAVVRSTASATSSASRAAARVPRAEARDAAVRLADVARAKALRAATNLRPPGSQPDPQREALRLNAAGAQLRRAGAFAEAADQHRAALAVLDEAGDKHAAALTLNNLALALDRTGDDAALDLFEQAATTLGSLGDEQGEGQVIANLAVALRRRGNSDRSAEVLELALQKLDEDSPAYRKVDELRRAS
jgi:tetratricopeptide (TPR) repeat protein